MGFAGLEKLRIPKAIAKPPESLESLQFLETLSGLIAQKTLNKPEQLENAQHEKEMFKHHDWYDFILESFTTVYLTL